MKYSPRPECRGSINLSSPVSFQFGRERRHAFIRGDWDPKEDSTPDSVGTGGSNLGCVLLINEVMVLLSWRCSDLHVCVNQSLSQHL